MKSSTRQIDGVTIVDLSGRITLGEGSVILRDTVRELMGKGSKKILLNLGDVNYIDSSGIGELVSAYTTVKNQGGELKLLNLTRKVHDVLQITKLYTVFDVKDDEAEAIHSFAPAEVGRAPLPLMRLFGTYGKLHSMLLVKGDIGESHCFAFIGITDHDQALKAIDDINGTRLA